MAKQSVYFKTQITISEWPVPANVREKNLPQYAEWFFMQPARVLSAVFAYRLVTEDYAWGQERARGFCKALVGMGATDLELLVWYGKPVWYPMLVSRFGRSLVDSVAHPFWWYRQDWRGKKGESPTRMTIRDTLSGLVYGTAAADTYTPECAVFGDFQEGLNEDGIYTLNGFSIDLNQRIRIRPDSPWFETLIHYVDNHWPQRYLWCGFWATVPAWEAPNLIPKALDISRQEWERRFLGDWSKFVESEDEK